MPSTSDWSGAGLHKSICELPNSKCRQSYFGHYLPLPQVEDGAVQVGGAADLHRGVLSRVGEPEGQEAVLAAQAEVVASPLGTWPHA